MRKTNKLKQALWGGDMKIGGSDRVDEKTAVASVQALLPKGFTVERVGGLRTQKQIRIYSPGKKESKVFKLSNKNAVILIEAFINEHKSTKTNKSRIPKE